MRIRSCAVRFAASLAFLALPSLAQEWTEQRVVQKFMEQSPYAREARARVAAAEAQALGRTLLPNPSVSYSREGAGFTEFFQAEQALPVSGRRTLLREAGAAAIRTTAAEGAFDLWQARTNLRVAFYAALAAQDRARVQEAALQEIDEVLRILREREREGEGSTFDRIRAERERAELLAQLALLRAEFELYRSAVLAYLPTDTQVDTLSGALESLAATLDESTLLERAYANREDYRAELARLEQFRLEQRAAERLRIPEPIVSGGLKRADVGINRTVAGGVIGVTVPIPLFDRGQTEVSRYSAEQERVSARLQILRQQIHSAVTGAVRAFNTRVSARDQYRRALGETGAELVGIARVAYQEGEIGILQLLDAYRNQREANLRMIDIQAAVKEAELEVERVMGEEIGR